MSEKKCTPSEKKCTPSDCLPAIEEAVKQYPELKNAWEISIVDSVSHCTVTFAVNPKVFFELGYDKHLLSPMHEWDADFDIDGDLHLTVLLTKIDNAEIWVSCPILRSYFDNYGL